MYAPGNKYETALGIGYGRAGVHSQSVPIDAVRFVYEANKIRKGRTGALILADTDVNPEITGPREEIVRKIIAILEKDKKDKVEWDIVRQTQMPRDKAAPVTLGSSIDTVDRKYVEREVEDAGLVLEDQAEKIGWVLDRVFLKNNGIDARRSKGGERIFDKEIERNFPGKFKFRYTPVIGTPLSAEFGRNKCPYLVKGKEEHRRTVIIADRSELESEIGKLRGILHLKTPQAEAAKQAALDFAWMTLGLDPKELEGQDLLALFEAAQLALNN